MPSVKGMNDSEGEEVDQETAESEKTSNDDSGSSSPSGTEDEDSSEMDEEDCERRRTECITQMADIEKQFSHLKEQLYEERVTQVSQRLEEVKTGSASEYIQPLDDLKENMRIRLEVAGILKELKLVNIKHKFEAEEQACLQNFESEKALLWDSIKSELEEKIGRLEEDRNSIDITSDLWNEQVNHRKNKRKADFQSLDKRKKPVSVSGPYIVYMLHENDILEDWTTIRKALKAAKQNCEYEFCAEQRFSARFADGKLLFKGDAFRKGEAVLIEDKVESSWLAHIISVNTSEVLLQKQDGSWKRIFISDLQSGKYTIRHEVREKMQ